MNNYLKELFGKTQFGRFTKKLKVDNKGEGFIDTLVKMLIVVVIGAALLALLNVAIPGLFNDMIAKIRTTFGL